jgi:hypothetical protein
MSNNASENYRHRDIILFSIAYGDIPDDTAIELRQIIEKRVTEINPSYELGHLMMVDIPKSTPRYASTCNAFICFEKSFRNGAIVSDLNGSIRYRGKSIGVQLCDNYADHSCQYTDCTWSRVKDEIQSRARSSTLTASLQASSSSQTSSLHRNCIAIHHAVETSSAIQLFIYHKGVGGRTLGRKKRERDAEEKKREV